MELGAHKAQKTDEDSRLPGGAHGEGDPTPEMEGIFSFFLGKKSACVLRYGKLRLAEWAPLLFRFLYTPNASESAPAASTGPLKSTSRPNPHATQKAG